MKNLKQINRVFEVTCKNSTLFKNEQGDFALKSTLKIQGPNKIYCLAIATQTLPNARQRHI